MTRVGLTLIGALLAAATGMASAFSAEEQTAVAYITERYADAPEPGAQARYSPRIEKLWAQCRKREKKTGDPCMDFDIWVNAQDWEIKNLKVDLLKNDGAATTVLASFDNFDRRENINFRLIKDKKGWIVDEIATGRGTLSSVRQGKPSKC